MAFDVSKICGPAQETLAWAELFLRQQKCPRSK